MHLSFNLNAVTNAEDDGFLWFKNVKNNSDEPGSVLKMLWMCSLLRVSVGFHYTRVVSRSS